MSLNLSSLSAPPVPESLLALYLLKIAINKPHKLSIPDDLENRAKVEYKAQMGCEMPDNYTLEQIKQAVDKYYGQR